MYRASIVSLLVMVLGIPCLAAKREKQQATKGEEPSSAVTQIVDRIIKRENSLIQQLTNYSPIVETYLQEYRWDDELGTVPSKDHYFLGRLDLGTKRGARSYATGSKKGHLPTLVFSAMSPLHELAFTPETFSGGVVMDSGGLDQQNYQFALIRAEFLGDVRCLVFDVTPRKLTGQPRFIGRIWAEDHDYNVVRFNGTWVAHAARTVYFHVDSWRENLQPGLWLPVYLYSEESNSIRFKSQTRLWGYHLKNTVRQEDLTRVSVEAQTAFRDTSETAPDLSPIQSERAWEAQAENNALDRLESAGLLAPAAEVEKTLETVLNNLIVTNHLDSLPPLPCRVLLTTPLESFNVGHTIVLSRGLIDVLPDEANLAAMLAHELAHIVLGHTLNTQYAFSDTMMFQDESIFSKLGFGHTAKEEAAADEKALEFLKNSPYKDKLPNVGLFLRALAIEAPHTPGLLGAHLGNRMAQGGQVQRMAELLTEAPKLVPTRMDQLPALPLGTRIKVNAWTGSVEMMKSKPVALVSAREKMSFLVTPLFPHLTRAVGP